jgi:multidrug efflux system outer membrane protein
MRRTNSLAAVGFSLTLLASGCASYKDPADAAQALQADTLPASFSTAEAFTAAAPVADWWENLHDDALTQLVDSALQQNLDIRAARATLEVSRALLRNSRNQLLPTADVVATSTRQNQVGNPLAGGGDLITETRQGGFDLNWEADLFGRLGSEAQVAAAQMQVSEDDLRAAQVSIAAEVANAYIGLRGAQYQLRVAQDSARNQQETFDLTVRLAEIGRGDQFDVTRARAQLDLTQSRIPSLQADIDVAINRLMVLTRQPIDELKTSLSAARDLPSVPAAIAIGSPLDLLKRRPDIRRAEHELQGAIAGYNVRVADLYPRVTFGGSLGYLSSDWGALGSQSGQFFAFAPTLRWAGLNAGRVLSQIDAADARIDARAAAFEQSVLLALEETDNALQRFSREEERRLHLLDAAQASTQAAQFARQRFEIGSSDFIGVLDAERSQLAVNAELAQSETQLLLNLVAVYKALGGAWE